jgi:hypothetical protein
MKPRASPGRIFDPDPGRGRHGLRHFPGAGQRRGHLPHAGGQDLREECGSCHTAFAPGLLPARAWRKMMGELASHFGEDASLEEPQRLAILKDLETLASDGPQANMRMRRINGAIPGNTAPQRIADTGYFKYMHDEVPKHIWQRKKIGTPGNCIACHTRANEGSYGEREVRIPQ